MSNFENVRRSYRPRRITTLFVGESAPHGGTFFYNRNSGLFREIRKAFQGTESFLEDFKRNGFYLDDLVLEPVNHLERAGSHRTLPRIGFVSCEKTKQLQTAVDRNFVAFDKAHGLAGNE